jgi:hypothetical protein
MFVRKPILNAIEEQKLKHNPPTLGRSLQGVLAGEGFETERPPHPELRVGLMGDVF